MGADGSGRVVIPRIKEPHVFIHNHPDGAIFSHTDLNSFTNNQQAKILTAIRRENG